MCRTSLLVRLMSELSGLKQELLSAVTKGWSRRLCSAQNLRISGRWIFTRSQRRTQLGYIQVNGELRNLKLEKFQKNEKTPFLITFDFE